MLLLVCQQLNTEFTVDKSSEKAAELPVMTSGGKFEDQTTSGHIPIGSTIVERLKKVCKSNKQGERTCRMTLKRVILNVVLCLKIRWPRSGC